MNTHPYRTDDSTDPSTTISISEIEDSNSRHYHVVERELGEHTFALFIDEEIGELKQTDLYMIAERVDDEYRVRTRFRLVDLRVSQVAHPTPRNLSTYPRSDFAKEIRNVLIWHPDDVLMVHPGGLIIEHPDHGPYSLYVDSGGEHVADTNGGEVTR